MKIALKYGLFITAGVIAWVVVAHLLQPDPSAKIHTIGAGIFFNAMEIAGITLGIKARQRKEGILSFKTGVKTGVGTASVYGVTASLFFLFRLLWVGSEVMAVQGSDQSAAVALKAFGGLLLGALLFGLVYSTVISFIIVGTQRGRRYD